ncbi:lysine N(6)-hydroxylase/L-ornithine N(5)-oxygenase family protein [Aliikangiella coralliicola]|uniref:SidA/IucD/PvdA family monooxygenase n=1 Tax=Aliikangiella coralliicola TaxID=2592383 RepID=A0A545U960_9GAMM|nr:SidA/IucD/PvdA family monooxygenase [Aliikangiella coralliicola]TQV85969.1 hypothetical protein FLL46_18830 [Aliikangiella coralliicola]
MEELYEFIGVGAGVFNLSLAALLEDKGHSNYVFLDKKSQFSWHGDMMLPKTEMQTDPIKDIVTPVEPTNRFSFLNYLQERGILYQFFNRKGHATTRKQFSEYLKWAANGIKSIQYSVDVTSINYEDNQFFVETDKGRYLRSKHLVLGCGIKLKFPACAEPKNISSYHHSAAHMKYKKKYDGRKVAIIGGGQSGAEIFYDIISNDQPESISWFSGRSHIAPLEDSCFSNEIYTPEYIAKFYTLPAEKKEKLNREFLYTSDGVTQSLSDAIYNELFENKYFLGVDTNYNVKVSSRLIEVEELNEGYKIFVKCQLTSEVSEYIVDDLIFATGYTTRYQSLLSNVSANHSELNEPEICEDYSINWRHSATNKIYVQNGAKHTHGVSDPNISLAAWRASVIANSLFGEELFKMSREALINF